MALFEGLVRRQVAADGVAISLVMGGSGPPVLLLHGYPQTHVMWHKVAPRLAADFTVVAADLRGYGDSVKPPGDVDHANYSKRTMARDQVEAMRQLGFDQFAVVGHDRGARVAYRMALDHPEQVTKLAVLDIVPTHTMFANVDREFALGTFHWFFLAQPYDLPERLIGGDPEYYLRTILARWAGDPGAFAHEAMEEYVAHFRDPACIHASCEDYRAGATVDLAHDEADHSAKHRIACPVLAL